MSTTDTTSGLALALDIAVKQGAIAGATMLVLMWSASLPPSDPLVKQYRWLA